MSADALLSVDDVLALLRRGPGFADEEDVDQLAHALQCAARLEQEAPLDLELQIAGLVHDIASIAAPDSPATHAPVGGRMVRALFGTRVAQLVSLHADAKRYLVTTDPGYRATLSRRSLETLVAQGGLLSDPAVARMQQLPELEDALTLRRADDGAKVANASVAGLDHWEPVLRRVAST
ncbi:MAG: metal-dependent phosphohydrolase [Actinomycetia bacterium]|nr:metal-dependent phosphohydrolase [Actinomycetes bacterium]